MRNKAISVRQAQAFDKFAQEKLGIPSIVLMENAGRSVAEACAGRGEIAVVCGTGNNGGDGFAAARHLLNAGREIKVFVIGEKTKLKNDAKINLDALVKMLEKVRWVSTAKGLKDIAQAGLIVDALFGIGLNTPVAGLYRKAIEMINRSKIPVVSVDVPSGLNADTGRVMGMAVRADKTVTFVAPKKGFYKADGPLYCGEVIVRDIGIIRSAAK
ncbi:MAG: NAD(P)H-hydrate epimerase [Candidatus Saganbacteria bacterium]|nr:NAD(P)H-hydrate epimerase [Candidatus Saganbacteria bacterium]